MQLRIDFAGNRPRPTALGILFCVLSLGACTYVMHELADVYAERQVLARSLAEIRSLDHQDSVSLSGRQIEAINHSVRQLNLPWQDLLVSIEGLLSERVALLALEPDASTRVLRIQGEAKSANDMVDFVDALNNNKCFVSAMLVRHEISDSDRNRPYRFVVEVEWSPEL